MLSTAEKMAAKLAEAMAHPPIKQAELAAACGVSIQAVHGWLHTGRIDKKHFAALARATGRSLDWWFDAQSDKSPRSKVRSFAAKQALSRMGALADRLSDDDWLLLANLAEHLVRAHGPGPKALKGRAAHGPLKSRAPPRRTLRAA